MTASAQDIMNESERIGFFSLLRERQIESRREFRDNVLTNMSKNSEILTEFDEAITRLDYAAAGIGAHIQILQQAGNDTILLEQTLAQGNLFLTSAKTSRLSLNETTDRKLMKSTLEVIKLDIVSAQNELQAAWSIIQGNNN